MLKYSVNSVVPPGHDYAWYNIRTCVSDEGHFYVPRLFESRRTKFHNTPGTLEVLGICSLGELQASNCDQIIAYFMIVTLMLEMTEQPSECLTRHQQRYADSFPRFLGSNLTKSMLQKMAGVLCMPVFAWLPRIREALELQEVDQCTRVLAWTAPFATLALYRCFQRCESESELHQEADSMDLQEADDAIVTDMERFMGSPEPQLDPTLVSGSNDAHEEAGEASAVEDEEEEDDNPFLDFSMADIAPEDLESNIAPEDLESN
jgi:hypothetical protein